MIQSGILYQTALDYISQGVCCVDTSLRIVYWSKAAERITGYRADSVKGRSCGETVRLQCDGSGCKDCEKLCPLGGTMQDGVPRQTMLVMTHSNGLKVPLNVTTVAVRDGDGSIVGAVEIFNECADLGTRAPEPTRMDERFVDPATGLPVREAMVMQIHRRLEELKADRTAAGLILLQMNEVALLQKRYGAGAVAQVMNTAGRTISSAFRLSDLVGHWEPGTFVLLIPVEGANGLRGVGRRLQGLMRNLTLKWWGDVIKMSASAGCAAVRDDDTLETLAERATVLMAESRRTGEFCFG